MTNATKPTTRVVPRIAMDGSIELFYTNANDSTTWLECLSSIDGVCEVSRDYYLRKTSAAAFDKPEVIAMIQWFERIHNVKAVCKRRLQA